MRRCAEPLFQVLIDILVRERVGDVGGQIRIGRFEPNLDDAGLAG